MDGIDYEPHETRPAPAPPPELEALQQMLNDAINREIMLRTELVRVRRSVTTAMATQAE